MVNFNNPLGTPIEYEYVGFWARVGASLVDTVLYSCLLLLLPLGSMFNNVESYSVENDMGSFHSFSTSWSSILPQGTLWSYLPLLIITVLFWRYRSATPGKMLIKAKVVDAKTGLPLTTPQSIIRYLGYFVSTFLFFLGFIWVAFDSKKQGFHDKLAGSVVIRPKSNTFQPDWTNK